MIYVIEGPDGAGKTTLIQYIKDDKRHQCHFLSSSAQPKTKDEIEAEVQWIQSAPATMHLFLDRYRMISEPIYGHVLRGSSLVDFMTPPENTIFIYCRPPTYNIVQNMYRQSQLKGVHENIEKLIIAYDLFFHKLAAEATVLKYDYTHQDPRDFIIDELFQG